MTTYLSTVRAVGVILLSLICNPQSLFAQGTAFTYQGRLVSSGAIANGDYDFVFSACDAAVSGTLVGGPVTNANVAVTNGLFTTAIDLGPGVFTGSDRWLEIAVRTNGSAPFTTLSPRQALTASPYAIHAGSVNAAGISGTITSNMLATGAAAGNLVASGNSPVGGSGVILSSNQNATSLLSQGYTRLGGLVDLSWQDCSSPEFRVRNDNTTIWTGTKMIVWGGSTASNPENTGEMYDPAANLWQSVTTNNAPTPRYGHTAVWTGSEMIIWGGSPDYLNGGGRYNPTTGTWQPISTNNAPAPRSTHSTVWTGTEMIVWGGNGANGLLNSGGRYNPITDTWLPLSTNNAPSPRTSHSAVWTGNAMVIWGGLSNSTTFFNNGAQYNPATDTWSAMTTNGAPSPRSYPVVVWTGNRMFVWGGRVGSTYYDNGGLYNPATDTWSPITTVNAPAGRYLHSAVWTGTEVFVWGGSGALEDGGYFNDGGRYNPSTDSWLVLPIAGTPEARTGHSAVWTGTEMLVYGRPQSGSRFGTCYSYAPSRVMYLYQRQ